MENKNPQEDLPLEFLKREDVRTMAKDLASLREGQANVERARISNSPKQSPVEARPQPDEEVRPRPGTDAVEVGPRQMETEPQPETLAPLMPHQKRGFGKLFIRILLVAVILFVIFNALALAYWLSQKDQAEVRPQPNQSTVEVEPQPLITPDPVFAIASTEQIPLQKGGNIVSALQESFTRPHTQGFTRIVLANPNENRVWTAKEFFSGLSIPVPQEVLNNLQENLTLFVYANSQNKNRLGFAVPIVQGKNIQAGLIAWEANLERDLSLFLSFQGQKDSFAVSFFRESVYKGERMRYQTLSSQDLGLVYAVVNNTFVVTSSLESMKATIDEMKK